MVGSAGPNGLTGWIVGTGVHERVRWKDKSGMLETELWNGVAIANDKV